MSGGAAADSDGIHPGDSIVDKTIALSQPSTRNAVIYGDQCGNESSTKQTGDFDKDKTPIYDSVLDRAHPDIIGMHPYTAVNHLFFSSLQFWIATPDSLSLPVGVADVGGINRSPSDFHTSQTFTSINGNQTVITDSHSNHDLRLQKCLIKTI